MEWWVEVMRTYVVSGVAGFIASQVAKELLDRGDCVVGLDNLNEAYDPTMKHWRLDQLRSWDRFTFIQLDIEHREPLLAGLNAALGDTPAAVINLAARAGVRQSVARPELYVDCNVTGTLNMLEYCRAAGVSKFVLASTSSLYGATSPLPFSEDTETNAPLSPYAASKKGAEALAHAYHHLHGIDVTVFRYFTVYGPAGRPDMSVFRFIQWIAEDRPLVIYGDGTQGRDFTYVEDIARGDCGWPKESWLRDHQSRIRSSRGADGYVASARGSTGEEGSHRASPVPPGGCHANLGQRFQSQEASGMAA